MLDRGYPCPTGPPLVVGEQDHLGMLQECLDPDEGQELVVADAGPGAHALDSPNGCPPGGSIAHVIRADVSGPAQPGVPHGDRHRSSGTERKIKKGVTCRHPAQYQRVGNGPRLPLRSSTPVATHPGG